MQGSARISLPNSINAHVEKADGLMGEPLGGHPMGGQYIGHVHSKDLKELAAGLKIQSQLSACAAKAAAISALLQVASLALQMAV